MLGFGGEVKVFMCIDPVDLRKGFEGLSALTEQLFPEKLLTGSYFVFLNKVRTSVKILYWDCDGFALWCKRLEKGTFPKNNDALIMDRRQFFMFLEGIIPQRTARRFSSKKEQ